MDYICEQCPHCQQYVIVAISEINCGIFRHGVERTSFQQMNPHETKEQCDNMASQEQIYGCGKPFKVTRAQDDTYKFEACEYV